MGSFTLAVKLLGGDWRSGELRVLTAALALAVASVATVGLFADRMRRGLDAEADRLLGADLMVAADHPLPQRYADEAHALGLEMTPVVRFNSMIQRRDGGPAVLTDVKAVTAGYPLEGSIVRVPPPAGQGHAVAGSIPLPGDVWIDRELADRLHADRGTMMAVGDAALRVAAIFAREPELAGLTFAPTPKLLLNAADLPATQLLQPGTRASYRLMIAARGDPEALDHFLAWAARSVEAGERVETARDLRPELRQTLERAERYLGLAALSSVLLAAAAVALAAGRFLRRHLDVAAMLRCFGAPASRTLWLFLAQFGVVGALASVAGAVVAVVAQQAMVELITGGEGAALPWPSWRPLAGAIGTALVLLLGFALPPLVALAQVPPLRVLRRELAERGRRRWIVWVAAVAAIGILLAWQARAVDAVWLIVGAVAALLVVAVVSARLIVAGIARLPGRAAAWRFGLVNLHRHALASSLQIAALGLGAMALLVLAVVRGNLLADWRASLPPDAPNRFVVNILPDQRDALRALVDRSIGIAPSLEPMVRARLVEVNGSPPAAAHSHDPRTRRLAEREFNLSWTDRLPPANRVVAGRFWGPHGRGADAGISFEEGIASRFGIEVGDRLTFDAGGVRISAAVTSLRKVEWDSFRVNFFALFAPGALDGLPVTWISAFRAPEVGGDWVGELVRQFPNVLVIDVTEILAEIEGVIDRVAQAVEFIFVFTLVAGLVVLEAVIVSTQDERRRDAAILRSLGASTRQLRRAFITEFALIGAVAGALGAAGATALGHALASQVFDTPYRGDASIWVLAGATGALLVAGAGWLGIRRTLRIAPLAVLRELA